MMGPPRWTLSLRGVLLLVVSLPGLAFAGPEESGEDSDAAEQSEERPERLPAAGFGRTWLVVPIPFYSQETSLGFVLWGSVNFRPRGVGEATWPSTIDFAAVYTLRNQVSVSVLPTLYLGAQNDWVVGCGYSAQHYPTRYYGIGPSADAAYQPYTEDGMFLETGLRRRITGRLYVGVLDRVILTRVRGVGAPELDGHEEVPVTNTTLLGAGDVPGEDGSRLHALSATLRWDDRDNALSTRVGTYLDLEIGGAPTWIGSNFAFARIALDARGFLPLGANGTVAAQWLVEAHLGDVPFTTMPILGGDEVLRGMYAGRYRDHGMTALQLELRHRIVWRLGFVAFGDLGQVVHEIRDPWLPPKWTAGGGLRFELDPEAHSVVRLDVGAGPDGFGVIFKTGEAF